ncbi:MAG: pyrimidine 5'-nucleotidase [Pseudomonadota bacterium]
MSPCRITGKMRRAMDLPSRTNQPESWIIDLDNTLYPEACDVFAQIDQRMGAFIANLLSIDLVAARRIQKRYLMDHGTTLRGLMDNHGVAPRAFLDYVHDIDLDVVPRDPALAALLDRLPGRKLVYTNGDLAYARRVLARIGIDTQFEAVFDITAAGYVPKPNGAPLDTLVAAYGLDPRACVMIDDMARNLRPAHERGMTTVWLRTQSPYGRHDAEGAHVHHIADDLKSWLAAYVDSHQDGAP